MTWSGGTRKSKQFRLKDDNMKNDNTNIEALCESTRNSIETINEESADERSGVYVNMQDIFSD